MESEANPATALEIEGRAAQMHMAAALAKGPLGVLRWDKVRESVKAEWREKARADITSNRTRIF